MADQRQREVHDAPGQPASVHHLASQHEEGNSQQRKAVGAFDDVLRQNLRIEHVHVPHQGGAAQQQRKSDGNAQRHGGE